MVRSCADFGPKILKRKQYFHSFLKDEVRRNVWILALKRENFKANDHIMLGSKHFSLECFDTEAFGFGGIAEALLPEVKQNQMITESTTDMLENLLPPVDVHLLRSFKGEHGKEYLLRHTEIRPHCS